MISLLMTHVQDAGQPYEGGLGVTLAWLLPIVLSAAVVVGVILLLLSVRSRSRSVANRRLEVLEKALEHPQLDAETRTQLLATIVEQQTRSPLGFLSRPSFWLSACFVVGWLLVIFNGAVLLLLRLNVLSISYLDPSLLMVAVGLALLTLPVAFREFLFRARQSVEAR